MLRGLFQTHMRWRGRTDVALAERSWFAYNIAKGMQYLASKGIVHRDLVSAHAATRQPHPTLTLSSVLAGRAQLHAGRPDPRIFRLPGGQGLRVCLLRSRLRNEPEHTINQSPMLLPPSFGLARTVIEDKQYYAQQYVPRFEYIACR